MVVDTEFERAECVEVARATLDGCDVRWVGLRCDSETLAARAATRGDRAVVLGKAQADYVHGFCAYDLELDAAREVAVLVRAVLQLFAPTRDTAG